MENQFRHRAKKKLVTYNLAVDVLERISAVVPKGDRSYWVQAIIEDALDKIDTQSPETEGGAE